MKLVNDIKFTDSAPSTIAAHRYVAQLDMLNDELEEQCKSVVESM